MKTQAKTREEELNNQIDKEQNMNAKSFLLGKKEGIAEGKRIMKAKVEKIIRKKLADKKVMEYEYPTSALIEVQDKIKENK